MDDIPADPAIDRPTLLADQLDLRVGPAEGEFFASHPRDLDRDRATLRL